MHIQRPVSKTMIDTGLFIVAKLTASTFISRNFLYLCKKQSFSGLLQYFKCKHNEALSKH